MRWNAFETIITETPDFLVGPWRQPHQMLNAQVYDSHASIHDDATAQKLGFQGGTIEVRGWMHFRALRCADAEVPARISSANAAVTRRPRPDTFHHS